MSHIHRDNNGLLINIANIIFKWPEEIWTCWSHDCASVHLLPYVQELCVGFSVAFQVTVNELLGPYALM